MGKLTYIYGLKDPRDDKFYYVGRTNNPTRRNYEHRSKLKHTYSPWHRRMHEQGVKPVMVILAKTTENGLGHELSWMKKLRSEGHPLANLSNHSLGKISEKTFGSLKTPEQIKKEQGERIQARWRKWWDSLSPEEKSRRQRAKVNAKSKKAGRDFWMNMTPEQRKEYVRQRMERMSPENRQRVVEGWKNR